jgi:hypothetical protein
MQLTVEANDFTIIENGEATSLHGSLVLSHATDDGLSFTSSISGNNIAVADAGGSGTLSAFVVGATENLANGGYTFDIRATVDSPDIGGAVSIVTDSTFQGVDPDHPFTGQATITGANNSSVTLIAVDAVNVTLLVDEDGDGVTDQTIDTTWDNL